MITQTTDPHAKAGEKDMAVTGYALKKMLTLRADGIYTWRIDAAGKVILQGTWRLNPKPEQYRGLISLQDAKGGQGWFVNYHGEQLDDRDMIYMACAGGIRYCGTSVAKREKK